MSENVLIAITVAASGLLGALAGGLTTLASQILNHHWEKETELHRLRRDLYAEMAAIGSDYIGVEAFLRINKIAGKVMLIASDSLEKNVLLYMALIESLNKKLKQTNKEEWESEIRKTDEVIARAHTQVVEQMKSDLDLYKTK